MDRLSGFGMIIGSLEVPSVVALKDHLCKMTKTTELAHYELIIIGPSILSTFLSHHNLNNLFWVSLWHELLGYLIPLFGPIIIGLAQLVLLQNFYTNKNMYLWINSCGIGSGNYNAPRRFKFSFGKVCISGFPRSSI